jgi:hypothetical protein
VKVKSVEKKIRRIEGFDVRLRDGRGRRLRKDKPGLPSYRYRNAAGKSLTVDTWKRKRFRKSYPGYDVDVLDRAGKPVAGNAKLSTVRTSYRQRSVRLPARRKMKGLRPSAAPALRQPLEIDVREVCWLGPDFNEALTTGAPRERMRGFIYVYRREVFDAALSDLGNFTGTALDRLTGFIAASLQKRRPKTRALFFHDTQPYPFGPAARILVASKREKFGLTELRDLPGFASDGLEFVDKGVQPFAYWDGQQTYRLRHGGADRPIEETESKINDMTVRVLTVTATLRDRAAAEPTPQGA